MLCPGDEQGAGHLCKMRDEICYVRTLDILWPVGESSRSTQRLASLVSDKLISADIFTSLAWPAFFQVLRHVVKKRPFSFYLSVIHAYGTHTNQ